MIFENTKKSLLIFLIVLILSPLYSTTQAQNITINQNTENTKVVNLEQIFHFFGKNLPTEIPKSYEYISLRFQGVQPGTPLYKNLQKLVYLNKIANKNILLKKNTPLNQYVFFTLAKQIFDLELPNLDVQKLKTQKTTQNQLQQVEKLIQQTRIKIPSSREQEIEEKKQIFFDVYSTLINQHYNKSNITEIDIINAATEGLAKGANDKYTVYFPPTESKNFHESLNGEYEGIGSYVEMEQPGIVKIISPISGSPSQKAGLKGGDIILKVNTKTITKTNSLSEVVSWIKGPSGTTVNLQIKRGTQILKIPVKRAKIFIKDIEYNSFDKNTFYIQIKSFGDNATSQFKEALEELESKKYVDKLIIDLRNNGGGYLSEVLKMLGYFIPKGEPSAIVKYTNYQKVFSSKGNNLIDFSKYNLVILQNSGTASASEIMVGSIKDYYPKVQIIGEKSYGKGSVQTIKDYKDGSTIKYTIAKWFTGKNQIGIDEVGIEPTIPLELDIENYKKNGQDNQLQKAKDI